MSIEERLDSLESELKELKKWVMGLDSRTVGLIRLGPSQEREKELVHDRELLVEKIKQQADKLLHPPENYHYSPKVDRTQVTLTNPIPKGHYHTEILPGGQQRAYVILTPEERSKGFVRPVRKTYQHVKGCGRTTTISTDIAETYARDPKFYSGTFCCVCGSHFPLDQFVWEGTDQEVGS